MAGVGVRHRVRLPLYSGTTAAILRLAAALSLALGTGGCAVNGPLGSMFSKSSGADAHAEATQGDVTGSIAHPVSAVSSSALPSETDLVFTRMAVVDVLKRGAKEISTPWENPSSGARGTVTPIASAYERDGLTCHDFLASYVRKPAPETWLQGEACRGKTGAWEVKTLRPWSRS